MAKNSNVASSLGMKELLQGKKAFLFISTILTLLIDTVLFTIAMIGGSWTGACILMAIDLLMVLLVVKTNFRFKYGLVLPIILSILSIIICVLEILPQSDVYTHLAIIVFVAIHVLSVLALIFNILRAGTLKKGVSRFAIFLTLILFVGLMGTTYFTLSFGAFGQGPLGTITLRYQEYENTSGETEYRILGFKLGAKGDTVVIPETFNGKKVTLVDANMFSRSGIKNVYLEAPLSFEFENPSNLYFLQQNNVKVFVDKKYINDFVDKTMLKAPDVYPTVEKLTISRKDHEKDMVLEYDAPKDDNANRGGTSSSHIMTSPTFAYLTVERSTDIVTGMFGLYSDSIYAVKCTESDIAEAGLKEPYCTVTMECDDGNDYKLLLSEFFDDSEGKSCYAMFEGGDIIYVLDDEKAKWITL